MTGSATPPAPTRSFSPIRLLLGGVALVVVHALVIGAALLAAQLTPEPAREDDMADLLAVAVLGELAVAVAALIAIIVLLVKRRWDWAAGIALGWIAGPVFALVLALAQADSSS